MGTFTIQSNHISYPSGKYKLQILIASGDLSGDTTQQVYLKSLGDFVFGFGDNNPFLLYPNNFNAEITIPLQYGYSTAYSVLSLLRKYGGSVKLFKNVDGTDVVWLRGQVVNRSTLGAFLDYTIKITVYDDLIRAKDPIDKGGYTSRHTIKHFIENEIFSSLDTFEYLTAYRMDIIGAYGSIWDLFISDYLRTRSDSPYDTKGDWLKAILCSTSSFIMCRPFQKVSVIPMNYDGSYAFEIEKNKILSMEFIDTDPYAILMKLRHCSNVDYSGESYTEEVVGTSDQTTLLYPFPLHPGMDQSASFTSHGYRTTSLFQTADSVEDSYSKVVSYSLETKDRGGAFTQDYGRSFYEVAKTIYTNLFASENQKVQKVKLAGTDYEPQYFFKYASADPYSMFAGKRFRCRKYTINLKNDTTVMELQEA